jgi:predicted O-methyltransferase YrrM
LPRVCRAFGCTLTIKIGDTVANTLMETMDISFESLYDMILAPIKSRLLLEALELKVFNHLAEFKSAQEVSQSVGSHPRNTALFLDGLAACDLLEKRCNRYRNSPLSSVFLVEESPHFIGQLLMDQWRWSQPVLEDLTTFILRGPQQVAKVPSGESGDALANYERSGIAQKVSRIVEELPEFSSMRKMLDLGGGPGIIGMAVVASHPRMKGVIFELPQMAKVARKYVQEYSLEEKMAVMEGDYNRDSIGQEYDLVLACASLYSSKKSIDSIVGKVYEALNPGGVFVSIHEGLTHEKTKPEKMMLGWLAAELLGRDISFSQGEIADSMIRMGFRSVRSRTIDTPIGEMDLDVGRKA